MSMKLGKLTSRFVLYPLLLAGGCHTLLTGSPVPTWHIEKLDSPVSVTKVVPNGLVLGDGRICKLPLIKRLPVDDPLMLAAVQNGVEIGADGNVFGLVWVDRIGGNDPCALSRRRVNLATLAVLLVPDNFDESPTPAGAIAAIQLYERDFASDFRPRRYDEGRINGYDLQRMYRIERELANAALRRAQAQERSHWTFPASDLSDD